MTYCALRRFYVKRAEFMKKRKKTLIEKVQGKLEILNLQNQDNETPAITIESLKNLGKALASHLDAATHLEGAKKEYQIAKGHFAVAHDELRRAHKSIKQLMKQQAEERKLQKKRAGKKQKGDL